MRYLSLVASSTSLFGFSISGSTGNCGLEMAPLAIVPPHSPIGPSCGVTWGTFVLGIVPFSSHVRKQSLQRVTWANFGTKAAWTTSALVHAGHGCLPSVWLPLWTVVAYPVDLAAAPTSDVVRAETCLDV